jgi:histidinol phosphatase-like enzyme
MMKTIAIDLDGVIFKYDGWKGLFDWGDPVEGALGALDMLKRAGWTIIIFTTRTNPETNPGYSTRQLSQLVADKLDEYGIPWDEISLYKPLADVYLDDRAMKFDGWAKALKNIL